VTGALIVLYFAAMSVIITYPLITHLSTRMIGSIGDNIYFVWLIGWFKKALFELHVNPFNIWFLNYPAGWSLAYTEISPAQLLLAMPFALIFNPLTGYNVSMLLTFILSGINMYLWMKHLTGRTSVAIIIGTAFAILPYHLAHFLIGHLNISGIQWFPLFFWGLFELMKGDSSQEKKKFILLTGIGFGLIGMTSMYSLYMAVLVAGALAVINLFFIRKKVLTWNYWKPLLIAGLISIPFVAFSVWPYLTLNAQGGIPDRNLETVRLLAASASPLDYLLPSTDHFLVGKWVNDHFNRQLWIETSLYVGLVNIIFAGITLFTRKEKREKEFVILVLLGIALAWVLSLGTDLFWNGERLQVQLTGIFAKLLNRTETYIILPDYFLFKYLPLFSKMRVFARFGIFVLIFVLVLSAMGLTKILDRFRNKKAALVFSVFILGVVWLEFYPGVYETTSSIEARPVDTWLAEQPGTGAVIQFPIEESEDQILVYATLIHGKPFIGGFFNAFPPLQYQEIKPVMANFPDESSISLLDKLKVRYVLVDKTAYNETPQAIIDICKKMGLDYVNTMGDEIVFLNDLEE
jgi:hypothetical protein